MSHLHCLDSIIIFTVIKLGLKVFCALIVALCCDSPLVNEPEYLGVVGFVLYRTSYGVRFPASQWAFVSHCVVVRWVQIRARWLSYAEFYFELYPLFE